MNLDLEGKFAIVTGAGGAIAGETARTMAREGVSVAVWDIDEENAWDTANEIQSNGGRAVAVCCDATDKSSVQTALEQTLKEFNSVDFLINGAGGGNESTTTSPTQRFFDLSVDAMKLSMDLNYLSSVITSQCVGAVFSEKKSGVIINITSIAGIIPLTRAISYCDAKSAVNSFTRWLAVHMATHYSTNIRVNAIAPGFILTRQNQFLLIDEKTNEITERGAKIIDQVPMARYGNPEEISGLALWLVSEHASFVTGAVIPVDGGFTAYSGV